MIFQVPIRILGYARTVAAQDQGHPKHLPRLQRAVPRRTKWAKIRKECTIFEGAPVQILVPWLCPGSRKILAPPLCPCNNDTV